MHVRRAGARFDLLLTDAAIRGMNGVDLAEAIRAVQPGLVLLFTTGYSASPVLRSEREIGGMVEKAFCIGDLAAAVHNELNRAHQERP